MSTLAVFVDFKSAYDLISRKVFLEKLLKINTPMRIVRNFLCQRFISVRNGDRSSSFKQVKRGLPNGAVSSTTLFNVMINDFWKTLRNIDGIDVILYADDLVILVTGIEMNYLQNVMNTALRKLNQWTVENEMVVNLEKTMYQIFSLSNNIEKPLLTLGSFQLLESLCQTYLEIHLDQRLTFKNHGKLQAEKAEKRLKNLKRLAASTWGSSLHTLITTYKSYILPVLTFAEELMICGTESANKPLDLVHCE